MIAQMAGVRSGFSRTAHCAFVLAHMQAEPSEMLFYKRARFVTQLPRCYRYTPSHFWIGPQGDGLWRVGLTKFATRMLGETVDYGFEIALDSPVAAGQVIGWIEGFKALSDLFCVASGRFAGANPGLETQASLVNEDPYGAGWLYAVRGEPDLGSLDVDGYAAVLDQTIDRILKEGT